MKQRILCTGLALVLVCALAACSAPAEGTPPPSAPASPSSESSSGESASEGSGESSSGEVYHKITAQEAKEMMDAGGVVVVDVRTQKEHEEKRIPGAVLVPVESIGEEPPEALPQKDAVLLIHCRTGVRSKQAADKLIELGYTSLYDFGGIADWPYETESGKAG